MPNSASSPPASAPSFWLSGKRHAEQDHFFRQTLEAQGWVEGNDQNWQAAWVTGMPPASAFKEASSSVKMNHIPGNAALTVKSRLHASLSALHARTRCHFGNDHSFTQRLRFFPRAYEMPHDYPALLEDVAANPEKRWILKPTNASKGQGVQVLNDLAKVPLSPNWLVQEYIANPHTIRGHKYVLRLYMLIASIDPLRVYLYKQGFAKLASEPWDPDDVDNPFSQLTNPDINALNLNAEVPVEFIDLERYRHWLREQGHDDNALFNQLHDLATLTALSGVDAMRARAKEAGADPRGCYELIGLDCLVDDQLKPWILECNLSPSLGICAKPEHGGDIERDVKGSLVRDMINLVGLTQPASASDNDSDIDAAGLAAEHQRAGGFVPLYPAPTPERHQDYLAIIGLPSRLDYHLANTHSRQAITFRANDVSELIDDQRLALYHHTSGRYYQLNDSAALIWLLVSEGESLANIVAQLHAASGGKVAPTQLEDDLWTTLTPWWQHGLLAPAHSPNIAAPRHQPRDRSASWYSQLTFDGRRWPITAPAGPLAERIQSGLAPALTSTDALPLGEPLHLLESANGYWLATDSHVVSSRLSIDAILPAITRFYLNSALRQDHLVLDVALLSSEHAHFICLLPDGGANVMALNALREAAEPQALTLTRGARLALNTPTLIEPLNLPVNDAPFTPMHTKHFAGILWLDDSAEPSSEPPSPLDLLGALLPFVQEQSPCLSHAALEALQPLCQQPQRAKVDSSTQAIHQTLTAWLSSAPHTTPSHAAV